MTSKEDLKMIKIKCHPNANLNPMIDEALNNVEKDLEVLEILKPYLKQALEITEYEGEIELRFKPIAFGFGKIMSLDFNFNDTPQIKNIQKVKEWLNDK